MMPHCPNLNDTLSLGPLTKADFPPEPAEAATDVGQDVTMPYDGTERRKGFVITAICALVSIAAAAAGLYFKT